MNLTAEQCLKWLILDRAAELYDDFKKPVWPMSGEDIDKAFDRDDLEDAPNEIRCSGIETGLECSWSRHYESKAVAAKLPDGRWVGWTYWYGGGKHGEPEAIPWIEDAYFVIYKEEQRMVTVREFSISAL